MIFYFTDEKTDFGTVYIDQNTDRNSWSSLEFMVCAVSTLHSDFDFEYINVVTDRKSIRKLFAFVAGEKNDFEFGVELIGTFYSNGDADEWGHSSGWIQGIPSCIWKRAYVAAAFSTEDHFSSSRISKQLWRPRVSRKLSRRWIYRTGTNAEWIIGQWQEDWLRRWFSPLHERYPLVESPHS